MNTIPKQYDEVRILELAHGGNGSIARRPPRVGDVAYVVEVYTNPPGYELECVAPDGETEWLSTFVASEIALEVVKSHPEIAGKS